MRTLIKSSLVAFAVITSNISLANSVSPDFLINEIDTVYKQYLHGSPEVATYALESFVRLLESDQSTELLQKTGPSNLSFSYIRLGFLYEKSGLKQKAAKVFSKGVASYKSPYNKGVAVTLSELKSVVNQLDAKSS
ncbi:hypothetical protein [Colwellia sp. MB02u-14]|uniref:hypothetical protein n=1 Tax=Colwellia sp. MB02u-14 TaxID=2759815 RepID=UPI0015F64287|nr:hypothetical protein [Colwellia sp. MB02u-14]MBA6304674.1 hypothetical protein [Colwellia sp. MB02u-14]